MRIRSAETKFLVVSFVLVLLLGVKTVASLLEEPPMGSKSLDRRQPASIAKQPASLEKAITKVSSTANFVFNCQKEFQKEVTVIGRYLQIHGKRCAKSLQGDQVSIINKSNGYTAAVFPTNREEFQTDLIQLIEGQNQILIQYQNSSGKKFEQEVVVKSSHI